MGDAHFTSIEFQNCEFFIDLKFESCSGILIFQGSIFNEKFVFYECFNNDSLRFFQCKFIKELVFENNKQTYISLLEFNESDFKGEVILNGNFPGSIILSRNTFQNNLVLGDIIGSRSSSKNRISNFELIEIKSDIKGVLIINKAIINEKFWIVSEGSHINRVEIKESIFKDEIAFAHINIKTITIYGGRFFGDFKTNFANIKELYISGGRFSNIEIKEGYLEKFHISSFHEVDNLKISERTLFVKNLNISQSNPIKILVRKNTQFYITEASLFNWSAIKSVSFENASLHKDSVVQLYDLELREIKFSYYLNLGSIVFNNIEFHSRGIKHKKFKLSIVNSDLGKTSFIDCKSAFPMFDKFEFSNSRLMDSFFSNDILPENISYPEDKLFRNNSILGRSVRISEQKEILYNQLKKLSENKSDTSNAIFYKSKSQDAKRRILTNKLFGIINSGIRPSFLPKSLGKYFNILLFPLFIIFTLVECIFLKEKRRDFFEWITLTINQISNNHGSSWQRGTLVTILVIFGLFSFYIKLSGFEIGDWHKQEDKNLFFNLFSYVGEFLNPIPREDMFKKFHPENQNIDFPIARLFGVFSRIVISFFIYQTIQAFRRFGKTNS